MEQALQLSQELAETVKILSWNIRKGEHADAACAWINEQRPDVMFWQEMQAPDLERVTGRLGMLAFPAARTTASGNDNVVFVRPDGPFVVEEAYEHAWAGWHAPANVSVRLALADGGVSPRALSLVCEHSCYWSADRRRDEAQWYTTLAEPGWLTIMGGDWNSYPTGEGPSVEEWEKVQDRAFYMNRTYVAADGTRVSDDRADGILRKAKYVDVARWTAEHTEWTAAVRPTCGYGPEKALQGGPERVDRTYVVRALVQAVKHFETFDTGQLRAISDHSQA
ncbi:MAG TPA: endonuclease/exonuclease/phosphatase family protein [Streptomyces sp.]